MNILYQCSEYPPFRNGGIGTATKIVAEELVSEGHHVYVVGYYIDLPQTEMVEEINGVTVYRFNLGLRRGKFRQKIFPLLNKFHLVSHLIQRELTWYEEKIETLIKKHDIDVLEMTDFYTFNFYDTRLRFKRFSVPTVIRVHGSASFIQHYSGKEQSWVVANDKSHLERADYLCSVSKFAERYVIETFPEVHFKKREVIYNPIESKFTKNNPPSDSKVILFIGKLIKTKGSYALAEAFNKVSADYPEWRLHYAGNGESEPIIASLKPEVRERVEFLGFCGRKKIQEEIDGCAFACIPSFFENFSMVPLEIMGRARAMIFTERTSGGEIVSDGADGYTVDPNNVDMIAEKMESLMKDVTLRNTFAERGYNKVVNQYTSQQVIAQLLRFYNECVDARMKN